MVEEFAFQHLETSDDINQNLERMRRVFGQEGVDNLVKNLIDFHHGRIVAGLLSFKED